MIQRRKPLSRSATTKRGTPTLKRSGKPKARNVKRSAAAFAHAYHSEERVAFIKSLPCVVCFGSITRKEYGVTAGIATDNAHTVSGAGKGLKAHYTTIVPMCRTHHQAYDQYRSPFNIEECREAIQSLAPKIEDLWLLALASGAEQEGAT